MTFQGFATWQAVLDYVRAGGLIWYHAPLDQNPRLVNATCRPKGRTVRVSWRSKSWGKAPFDPFTADSGHLDRFRKRVES